MNQNSTANSDTSDNASVNVYPIPEMVYIPIQEWEEEDIVIVIKDEAAWQSLNPKKLNWDIGVALDAPVPTEAEYKKLAKRCDGMGEILYAVGGGVAVDAAKFVAQEMDMPLICIPSALSVDAFWTWASGVREVDADGNRGVSYLEAVPPEIMLLDFELIKRAPKNVRTAGIIDVLSIATACFDWQLAEQRGKNPAHEKYDSAIANIAKALLQNALDCAAAAGRGDDDGLRALVNALAMEVQLCNLAFHSRAQEGSEHHFAYCAESVETRPEQGSGSIASLRAHGEYVGPGILALAEKQGQNVAPLRAALEAAGVPLNALPNSLIEQTLRELPAYVRKHNLPYSIAWEL
jgi:glycerol-1-phosphate dehydrogenase [NAD(P)+]